MNTVKFARDLLGLPDAPAKDKLWPIEVNKLHEMAQAIIDSDMFFRSVIQSSGDLDRYAREWIMAHAGEQR